MYEENNRLAINTKEKSFKCDLCNKSFTSKDHLNGHLKIHSREKPYSCTLCENIFSELANLKMHVRYVHKGEKRT